MAFTYASVLAALKAHAVAAGGALDVPILDVAVAHPAPKGRCIRIFYVGETEPEHMGGNRTLNSQIIGERIGIIAWFPVSDLSETATEAIEAELYDLKHELRTRILGDSQLGGMSTDLELLQFDTDFVLAGNVRYRTLEAEVVTDYAEYTIAP